MKNFILSIKSVNIFIWGYIFYLMIGLLTMLFFTKENLHLFINHQHNFLCDYFFKYITFLGDGITAAIISILLIMISVRFFLVFGLTNILAGFFSQILKRYIFPHALSPKAYFQNLVPLYFVPGVEIFSFNSFPSGHSATAFLISIFFASLSQKKSWQIGMLICAVLISLSRVYLSQHFFEDTIAGSIIGVVFGLTAIILSKSYECIGLSEIIFKRVNYLLSKVKRLLFGIKNSA